MLGVLWAALGLFLLPSAAGWGYDFHAYRDAAVRLLEHGTLYQPEAVDGPFQPVLYGLFMYSPPAGVAMIPTAWLHRDVSMMGVSHHLQLLLVLRLPCSQSKVSSAWVSSVPRSSVK